MAMKVVICPGNGCDYVKDGVLYKGNNDNGAVQLENEEQLDDLPEYRPTTIAFLPGLTKAWQKAADGDWEPFSINESGS